MGEKNTGKICRIFEKTGENYYGRKKYRRKLLWDKKIREKSLIFLKKREKIIMGFWKILGFSECRNGSASDMVVKRKMAAGNDYDELYRDFACSRGKIYVRNLTEGNSYTDCSSAEQSLDIAKALYRIENRNSSVTTIDVRADGNAFLAAVVEGIKEEEKKKDDGSHEPVFLDYLVANGLARALNVFHFLAPLEVLNGLLARNEPVPEVFDWPFIFSKQDLTMPIWQFWKLMTEDWNKFLKPALSNLETDKEGNPYFTNDKPQDHVNEVDYNFLRSQQKMI